MQDWHTYISGDTWFVKALCGKVWSPTIPANHMKEKCNECYPVILKFMPAS